MDPRWGKNVIVFYTSLFFAKSNFRIEDNDDFPPPGIDIVVILQGGSRGSGGILQSDAGSQVQQKEGASPNNSDLCLASMSAGGDDSSEASRHA